MNYYIKMCPTFYRQDALYETWEIRKTDDKNQHNRLQQQMFWYWSILSDELCVDENIKVRSEGATTAPRPGEIKSLSAFGTRKDVRASANPMEITPAFALSATVIATSGIWWKSARNK